MRLYVLSDDTIIEESQRVTAIHPLFDAVRFMPINSFYSVQIPHVPKTEYNKKKTPITINPPKQGHGMKKNTKNKQHGSVTSGKSPMISGIARL